MIIDVLVALLALLSIVTGYRSGMLSQLLNLFVLAGAFFLTRASQDELEPYVKQFMEIEGTWATTIALIIGWSVSYFFLGILRNSILRRWRRRQPESGGLDRVLGAIFSSTKTGFALYLVLAVILMAKHQIAQAVPQVEQVLNNSRVAKAISQYNILESERANEIAPPRMRALAKLIRLASDPKLTERLKKDDEARAKAQELVELLKEKKPELMDSLKEGDLATLANNTELMELINEPEVLELINSFPE